MKQYVRNSIIIIVTIIVFGMMYWNMSTAGCKDKIAGLCGNIMAGLVTGMVIYYLGNYKNLKIKQQNEQITGLELTLEKGSNINKNVFSILNSEKITNYSVIDWLFQALCFFEDYNKYFHKETISKQIEEIEKIINECNYSQDLFNEISKQEATKLVNNSIKEMLNCKLDIGQNLSKLRKDFEQLDKSIV